MATVDLTGATARSLDISPITPGTVALIDLQPGDVVGIAQVEVTAAFDGSPTIELGISGDSDLILEAKDVKLKKLGRYVTTTLHRMTGTVTLAVTFVAGGATVGAAKLLVNITREN